MKKYLPWIVLSVLLATLVYARSTHTMDQALMQDYYRELVPDAADFRPLNDRIATALDASGSTLAHVGLGSYVGYGGPMLVGVVVHPDGSLERPVIFAHRETQAYLGKIDQQGFYRQFDALRADDALTPGFDIDAVSGATVSSRAISLVVNEVAHTIAIQALKLTPKKAEMPWKMGIGELALVALFTLSILALRVKIIARHRLFLMGFSIAILGFWLNRSFSLAHVQSMFLGFFPDIAQNPAWYIVLAGALLPAVVLGKNTYCTFVCPFCGLQELTHKISSVNLPVGGLTKGIRAMRSVFLAAALFLGFLTLNPSLAAYEPFGTIFGLNGESYNWYLLLVMLLASFFFHRFWCRTFCPAGAFLDFLASKRRRAGKTLRCGKCRSGGAKCTASVPETGVRHGGIGAAESLLASEAEDASAGERDGVVLANQSAGRKRRVTKAQIIFVLFYAAGLFSIAWTVWENMKAP